MALVSMLTASGHGACAAAIFSATMGHASEAPSVRVLIRRAVSSAGAVHRSWLKEAVRHEVACDEWRSLKGDRLMSVT